MPEKQEVKQTPVTPVIDPSVAALIKDIVAEARKPVKTEKEIRDEQAREDERNSLRAIHKQADRNKAAEQNGCQHEHPNGVGTPVVYVAGLNRLYCQHCQLWIFPTIQEAAFNGSRVEPTKHPALWDRYYAKAASSGMA